MTPLATIFIVGIWVAVFVLRLVVLWDSRPR